MSNDSIGSPPNPHPVATPAELGRACALLAAEHPRLAEVVRVYGLGRPDEARQHYERTV